MNTRKTEKMTNSRLFNKGILPVAVATAMFGAGVASAFVIQQNTTIDNQTGGNSTTNYLVHDNVTLSTNNSMSVYYGTIDGKETNGNTAGSGMIVIGGNLTMHGNVGSSNITGNFTINSGQTLILASNVTEFNSANMTLSATSTLNLGNVTTGYNRGSSETLVLSSNISMGSGSTINVGNGTTISGSIYGASDGDGILNIHGNFTSGGVIGGNGTTTVGDLGLEVITVHKGNTFTISHESASTNYYINGTVKATGSFTGNLTGSVKLGSSGTLNLYNKAGSDNSTRVVGTIDGVSSGVGTLNINGTYQTSGVIGGNYKLAAINLSSSSNRSIRGDFTTIFGHNVNATTITIGASTSFQNATLQTIAGGVTDGVNIVIGGNIIGSGNASSTNNAAGGRFLVAANTTVAGSIGTIANRLADIRVEDGTILTITGADRNIYANNITMLTLADATGRAASNATLAFNGTGTTTVNGIIAGETTEGEGLIDINTGTVSFKNTVGTNTNYISGIDIADGSTMTTSSNIYANSTIKVRGTLNIDATTGITITANDANGDGGGLQIGNTSGDNGTLETASTITLSSSDKSTATSGATAAFNNATIKLNGTHSSHSTSATAYIDIGTNNQTLIMQGNTTIDLDLTNTVITDGATIVIVGRGTTAAGDGNNGTLNISGNITATAYQMFDITFNNSTVGAWSTGYGSDVSDKSLNATVTYRTSSAMGFTGNTKTVYDSAKTAIAADTTVFQALAGMTTDTALKNAIATMHPATGGAASASASISGSSMSTASTRMAYTRQVGLGKGMNAGSATLDESMWVQIFGADVDQDNVGGVSGYDADGQGLAIGIDGMSEDGTTRIGIAGSFANTDVSGKDSTTRTTTDIDTTQVMAYANKVNDDGSYLEGTASFAFNDNTGTRRILVGAVDRTASSAYDSTTFAVNVEAGWPQENDGTTITPTLGLAYSHLSADAYTETGAAGMNLNVTPSDYDTFEGKVGVKITGKSVDADGGIGRPEVRIGVSHNFGDDTADSTATFTAGGTSFKTTGVETDSTKVDLGLGYTYTTPEGDTDISVNIDGRKSSSYIQYGGGLTVKWKF